MKCAVLCVVVLFALPGCREGSPDEEGVARKRRSDGRSRVVLSIEERAALGVTTVVVEQGTLTTSALRYGRVVARPQEDALVVAPLTGRLVAPPLALGAQVAPGDLLGAIEPLVDAASRASLAAQRRELRGQIAGARAQTEAKRSDLARISALVASGLSTEAERARAQAELTAEQARSESFTHAAAELARMTGGRMELRAPVPGVLVALASETGALIQQGTVLARIVRAGPRWIDIAVPPGDPVGNGYRVHGVAAVVSAKLLNRGAVIEPDGTRRDRLEAGPETAGPLPPGATVPVEVLHEVPGLLVPAQALVRRGRERLVFVEAEPGHYQVRFVEVAARDDLRAAVASGLSPGERVVARGAASLLGELGAGGRE